MPPCIWVVIGSGAAMVEQRHDGTEWWPWMAGWQPYAAAVTNLTVGNGALATEQLRQGRQVKVRGSFTLGSTSAIGNQPLISLPAPILNGTRALGAALILDNGSRWYSATAAILAGSNLGFILGGTGTYGISANNPMAWTTGDLLSWVFEYETSRAL